MGTPNLSDPVPTLTDPVLGTLTYRRDWYEWSEWVGRVEFRPGEPVEFMFHEWRYGDESCADQLAKVRAAYLRLVENEWNLRQETVADLVARGLWPGVG